MKRTLGLILVMTATALADAKKFCPEDPQPTRTEYAYAGRVHSFLLAKGLNSDSHFACGQPHVLFIGSAQMTEALARTMAKSIGLGTAKVSGYSKIWFSRQGDEGGIKELWEYDLKTKKVRHGVQGGSEIVWQSTDFK